MEEVEATTFWVGIGASAGGLEALRELVRNLEPGAGAVYTVLQHMSPQHKSLLTELIGRETPLNVVEISDGTLPQRDTVYISPPNNDVIVSAGRLRLVEPSREPAAPKPSVDRFFQSLAETVGDRAIGIILSGTGSDGATGVRAIRAGGGITIAQSEESAKYNGMPVSAMDTGCVDLVMSAEEIGARFAEIVKAPRDVAGLARIAKTPPKDALANLFHILQLRTGVDFREYKPSTVRRRIERRMTALSLTSLEDYAEHVREHPEETKMLFKDMMISVTSFFRDAEEFEKLRVHLEPMLAEREGESLRAWVPGCASGEEAYSLTMMIAEALGGLSRMDETQIQVFATDIDAEALSIARRGVYPESIARDVPSDLLGKYFSRTDDGYQVSQALRERIVFTPHNLCQDPPFSNIDLISCRNLLIYFSHALQSKVFARLHYALKPSGLMFLGKSESISGSEALFKPAGDNGQVFRRRSHPDRSVAISSHSFGVGRMPYERGSQRKADRSEAEVFGTMFHALVRAIGPDGLLVTADLHIHRVYGNIDRFLSLSEGQLRGATINMLRDDLRHELRTLITLALRNGTTRKGLERRVNDSGTRRMQLQVHPIELVEGSDDMVLVIFREWEAEKNIPVALPESDNAVRQRTVELEQELQSTRESLQQTVEELETANEELQSLNEELQSANEELQSTNEELETTNEELQSTNEELITVNEELQINSHEMSSINQELDSVLSNIAAPVLVVDSRLHIVQCSQSARLMFQIAAGIAKPHLSQLSLPGDFPALTSLMAEVIQTGARSEMDIDIDGFRGSVVAAPYFNPKGELIGATAIVHEISDPRTKALEGLLNNLPLMIWQKDEKDKIVEANLAAARFMGVSPGDAKGKNLNDVLKRLPQAFVTSSLELNGSEPGSDGTGNALGVQKYLVPYRSSGASSCVFVVAANTAGVPTGLLGHNSSTDWTMAASDRSVSLTEDTALALGLEDRACVLKRISFLNLFHPDDRDAVAYGLQTALEQAIPFTVLARLRSRQSGFRMLLRGRAVRNEQGEITAISGSLEDAKQVNGSWQEPAE